MEKLKPYDYHALSLRTLNESRFSHVRLLLFWPIFGIAFFLLERVFIRSGYYVMYCPIDDYIPFCEYFVIPYFFWFLFLIGMHIYTFFFDVPAFRRFLRYLAITYWTCMAIYVIFPNCQEFRPVTFPRENWMTEVVSWLYTFDTNTNVCPSLHVVGSMAVMFAAWDSRLFSSRPWKIAFAIAAFVISVSTIFLRQHSIIDLVAALPICLAAYLIVYGRKGRGRQGSGE